MIVLLYFGLINVNVIVWLWLIGKFGRDRIWVVGCNKGYLDICIL